MSSQETHVLYKALADFSALSSAATKAKSDLRALRAEEKKLNSESSAENQRLLDIRKKSASSYNDEAKAARSAVSSLKNYRKELTSLKTSHVALNANMRKSLNLFDSMNTRLATNKRNVIQLRKEHERLNVSMAGARNTRTTDSDYAEKLDEQVQALDAIHSVLSRMSGKMSGFTSENQRLSRSSSDAARNIKNQHGELTRLQSVIHGAAPDVKSFGKVLNSFHNWRPRLIPPFVALVPIIGALLGLVNPLVAGVTALAAATIGLGSSLASLSGIVFSLAPGLAAILTLVSALKTAFGGIGAVFKKYQALQTATMGAGGGSSKEELSQTEQLQRAQVKYSRALEDVRFAQEDLTEARKAYLDNINDLIKALKELSDEEGRAQTNAQLASEYYAQIVSDPNVAQEDKVAAKDYADELARRAQELAEERQKAEQELADAQATGVEGSREVIQANRRLEDATWAVRDAELDLANTQSGMGASAGAAATAAQAFQESLDALSPSARDVVLQLLEMDGAWKNLKKTVQESFFSKIVGDIGLLKRLLEPLTVLLSSAASAAGTVSSNLIQQVTGDSWIEDLSLISGTNVSLIETYGAAFGNILDIIKDITVVAGPLAEKLADAFLNATDSLKQLVSVSRDDGSLAGWLETVYDRLTLWWDIVSNIGETLFNYGAASSSFGDWITSGLLSLTEGWKQASEDARETGSGFQEFLEGIQPALSAVNDLFGAFFGWLSGVATDEENLSSFTETIKKVEEELGPVIGRILDLLAKSDVSDSLIDALVTILDTIADFLENGGLDGFKQFYDTIDKVFTSVNDLVNLAPEGTISAIAESLAIISALTFLGFDKLVLGVAALVGNRKLIEALSRLVPGKAPVVYPSSPLPRPPSGPVIPGKMPLVTNSAGQVVSSSAKPSLGSRVAGAAKSGMGKGGLIAAAASIIGSLTGGTILDNAPEGKEGARQRTVGRAVTGAATGAGIGSLFGPVGTAVGGLGGALIAELSSPGDWWESVKQNAQDIFDFIVGLPGSIADLGITIWDGLGDFREWMGDQWDKAVDFFAELPGRLKTAAGDIWSGLKTLRSWAEEKWLDAVDFILTIPYKIGQLIGYIWLGIQALSTWFSEQWDNSVAFLSTIPTLIGDLIGFVWQHIQSLGSWLLEKWIEASIWLAGLPQKIADTIGSIWSAVQNFPGWLAENWPKAVEWFENLPTKIGELAVDLWGNLNGIGDWLADQWTALSDWITDLPNKINNVAKSAWKGVTGAAGWVLDQAKSGFNDVVGGGGNKKNRGGVIYREEGGTVPGQGTTDTVPAMLTPGEFVLRRSAVAQLGLNNLYSLNSGMIGLNELAERSMSNRPMSFFGNGGLAGASGMSSSSTVVDNKQGIHIGKIEINNPVGRSSESSITSAHEELAFRYNL